MAGGYLPVDTPPGTAPMPLGQPVPATPHAPATRAPRVPKAATPSGKGRLKHSMRKPTLRRRAS